MDQRATGLTRSCKSGCLAGWRRSESRSCVIRLLNRDGTVLTWSGICEQIYRASRRSDKLRCVQVEVTCVGEKVWRKTVCMYGVNEPIFISLEKTLNLLLSWPDDFVLGAWNVMPRFDKMWANSPQLQDRQGSRRYAAQGCGFGYTTPFSGKRYNKDMTSVDLLTWRMSWHPRAP